MWLHVPNLPEPRWLFAQESEVLSKGWSTLPPDAGLWLLSNGKPSARPSSWSGWLHRPWILLLSGTTSPPSTVALGVASWMSSLRASLARGQASPGSAPASMTSDGSGLTSGESSSSAEPDTSSSKTSPVFFPSTAGARSGKSSGTWPRAGGLRSGIVSRRQASAPRTSAIVSSASLPTPSASQYGSSQNGINGKGGENERPSAGTASLTTMARTGMLPTPTARDPKGMSKRSDPVKDGRDLTKAIMLPTPMARDFKGADIPGREGGASLGSMAASGKLLPTPTATDCEASGTAGNWSKESGRHSGTTLTDAVVRSGRQSSGGLRLSPRFVEWMMGFPIRWTEIGQSDFMRSATALFDKLRAVRSRRSGTGSTGSRREE